MLIAKRPCSFGGKRFYIGDEVPAEFVADPALQEKLGVLMQTSEQDEPAPEATATIPVVIHAEEGDLPLDITAEGLQAVVDVLTGKAADAEPIIEQMTDGDALILLHIADGRKAVKAAAEARAKAINEESAGEQ